MRHSTKRLYHLFRCVQVPRHGDSTVLETNDIEVSREQKMKLRDDEVLVRNSFAGVNFIDTYHRSGLYPIPGGRSFPFTLGLEGCGSVVGCGAALKTTPEGLALLGRRVAYCDARSSGAYASFSILRASDVFAVPNEVSDQQAAAVMLQGCTADYLVHDCAPQLQKGDTVLVHAAAGGTGRLLCQMAVARGLKVIGTFGGQDEKKKIVADAGAIPVDYSADGWEAAVKDLTEGKGCAAVFDGVGGAVFDKSLDLVRKRGDMITFGNAAGAVNPVAPLELTKRGSIRLQRPSMFDFMDTASGEAAARVKRVLDGVCDKTIVPHIDSVFPLHKATEAHNYLESRKSRGKILLDCKE